MSWVLGLAALVAVQAGGDRFDLICQTRSVGEDFQPYGETRETRLSIDLRAMRFCVGRNCNDGTMPIAYATDDVLTLQDGRQTVGRFTINRLTGRYWSEVPNPLEAGRQLRTEGTCRPAPYTERQRLF